MMAKGKVTLSPADRFALAKQRTGELVDHMITLIALHESNQVVLKTDTLSRQIPRSYAAHAFNNFRFSVAGFEVVRLCAFWEHPDLPDASILNVIDLVEDPLVRAEITSSITGKTSGATTASAAYLSIADEMAKEINDRIDRVISRTRAVQADPRLTSVRNHRHKFLAHNLAETRLEQAGPVAPMKNGDVDWLFAETEAIADELHHGINRAGFDWPGAHDMYKRQAESLWHGTKIQVLR